MNWYKCAFLKQSIDESQLGMKRDYNGIIVNVENPAGTIRSGIDDDGHEWHIQMCYDYGFIHSIKGKDGEGLDVYLGPDSEAKYTYVVHQQNPTTEKYDEDKVMLGFKDEEDAKKSYLDHYDNPDFFQSIDKILFKDFKQIVEGNKDVPSFLKWKKRKTASSNYFIKTAKIAEDEWGINVGDFQRWVVDALEVKAFMMETPYKIAISVNIYNGHISEMMAQEFWRFKKSEKSLAKSVFKKLCAKMQDIIEEFKDTESPNNLVHAYFRSELRKIDSEHLPKTNVPSINYSMDVPYEPDWRSTLYGNRYPTRETSGF